MSVSVHTKWRNACSFLALDKWFASCDFGEDCCALVRRGVFLYFSGCLFCCSWVIMRAAKPLCPMCVQGAQHFFCPGFSMFQPCSLLAASSCLAWLDAHVIAMRKLLLPAGSTAQPTGCSLPRVPSFCLLELSASVHGHAV